MSNEKNCPTPDCDTIIQADIDDNGCCKVWECPNCNWKLEISIEEESE